MYRGKLNQQNKYVSIQYRTNARYRLQKIVQSGLKRGIAQARSTNPFEYLPYTVDQLEQRLRQTIPDGYEWEDFMYARLHIDHIIPHSHFNYSSPLDDDFIACWSLDNLQLLPALENILKSDRLQYTGDPPYQKVL
jgi:hypothetical protein